MENKLQEKYIVESSVIERVAFKEFNKKKKSI